MRAEQARTGLIDARFEQPGCVLQGRALDEGDDSDDEEYCPELIPELELAHHAVDYVSSDDEDV
eukprot:896573-Prymnesium_polylepis.1